MITSVLGAGPMSKDIVRSCVSFSHETGQQIMLIASLNQVNRFGGYVEGWTTREFVRYTKSVIDEFPRANIVICRDHLGPGFCDLVPMEEVANTIEDDILSGVELIHIDMCHVPEKDKLFKTLSAVKRCGGRVELEVGTDENTGNLSDSRDSGNHSLRLTSSAGDDDLRRLLDSVCSIQRPVFVVKQTGSLVREDRQAGVFNREEVERINLILKDYTVKLKEHNADYLTIDKIVARAGLVGAVNIAPQLGVIQTDVVLNSGVDTQDFELKCLASNKWVKWVDQPVSSYSPRRIARICGHYNFGTEEYRDLVSLIDPESLAQKIDRFIQDTLYDYIEGLNYGTRNDY